VTSLAVALRQLHLLIEELEAVFGRELADEARDLRRSIERLERRMVELRLA
jgi:hypothetical protein